MPVWSSLLTNKTDSRNAEKQRSPDGQPQQAARESCSGQVFGLKSTSRYGNLHRHIRCHIPRRSHDTSRRQTYLRRSPRGSKHNISREFTSRGVHPKCAFAKRPCTEETERQYALVRPAATYGREGKANDYLRDKNIETFYPTLKTVKLIDGKRVTREESRIPNIFFARGTEEEIKSYVYDNVNLPYLRFYYAHKHIEGKVIKEPLVIPDSQMNSLKIICAADSEDIIASPTIITKFKEGQQVRITEGKFKGVVGTVARYHSQQRVGIIIDGLMTVCTAYVPGAFIEDAQQVKEIQQTNHETD